VCTVSGVLLVCKMNIDDDGDGYMLHAPVYTNLNQNKYIKWEKPSRERERERERKNYHNHVYLISIISPRACTYINIFIYNIRTKSYSSIYV
jgi:hypothetical protein